ncbi:hypothetical protein [Streptomyces sp. NPDC015131]|uniref:hypothetical protein n=1 Tax=Streptomyces sp. NPDC015131 TaxID=3364941 RepID=UPI003701E9A1
MVEGEGRSRRTGDPDDGEAGGTAARGPVRGLPEPAADLPALLAALGRHLEGHGPEEIVILLREELARREFQAYVSGWRDAADQYEPVLEEARRIAQTRRLRLVGRTPGQAAVIPFPYGSQGGARSPAANPAATDEAPARDSGRDSAHDSGGRAPAEAPYRERNDPGRDPGREPGRDPDRDTPAPAQDPDRDRDTDRRPAPATASAPARDRAPERGAVPRRPGAAERETRGPGRQGHEARARRGGGAEGAGPREQEPEAGEPGTGRSGLVAKSPHSRVPTIPPLPGRRRGRGDED